jgi:hypothetical protein
MSGLTTENIGARGQRVLCVVYDRKQAARYYPMAVHIAAMFQPGRLNSAPKGNR